MNCKPGDLAVVVTAGDGGNIGLFVTVLENARADHEVQLTEPGQVWHCEAKGKIKYVDIFGRIGLFADGPIPDECLRPIRPSPINTETETKQETEVTA